MKAEVQLVNEKGRAIAAKSRAAMPKYRGVLHINESRSQALGRICVTAQLLSPTDAALSLLLPELTDAAVLFLREGQMRVRGFEVMDGTQYGQTWDVKLA